MTIVSVANISNGMDVVIAARLEEIKKEQFLSLDSRPLMEIALDEKKHRFSKNLHAHDWLVQSKVIWTLTENEFIPCWHGHVWDFKQTDHVLTQEVMSAFYIPLCHPTCKRGKIWLQTMEQAGMRTGSKSTKSNGGVRSRILTPDCLRSTAQLLLHNLELLDSFTLRRSWKHRTVLGER